jgi:hypothetical protein
VKFLTTDRQRATESVPPGVALEGKYPESTTVKPQEQFHGFGTMEFTVSRQAGQPVSRGKGEFWDVDETRPEKTVMKSIQLHRIDDQDDIRKMTDGKEKEYRAVVVRTLDDW